jgi:Septum formation
VPVVPCDQPHTSEVYYAHNIPGDSLPSQSEMEDIVDAECVSRFEGFVGIPYPDSVLLVTWLEPTPESWAAGDRELLCLASGPPGEVVGTLEGSNR